MVLLLQVLLEVAALLLLLPTTVLFLEILFAVALRGRPASLESEHGHGKYSQPRVAVLMPAHNEAPTIGTAIRSLLPQLGAGGRLVVIADNCTDETAAAAVAEGAEVIIRSDPTRRGKGYALDFGIRHLEHDPPDIVVIVDADCRVAAGAIDKLARLSTSTARPIQALYLMRAGMHAGLKMRTAEFAWVVKNQARPEGLRRLGFPCQLMGTGMAFPWLCISGATLATGHIVEDLKLGIDLARAGVPPLLCPDALVISDFPTSGRGIQDQRTRWEHGHLSVIVREVPRLLISAVKRWDADLLALTLDLSVPPLALLTLLVGLVWIMSAILYIFTSAISPLCIATLSAMLLLLSVFMSWVWYGRQTISLGQLALALGYALWKIPLYAKFLVARQIHWVRSARNDDHT